MTIDMALLAEFTCFTVAMLAAGCLAGVAYTKTRECERLRGGVRFWRKRCEAMQYRTMRQQALRLERLDVDTRGFDLLAPEDKHR